MKRWLTGLCLPALLLSALVLFPSTAAASCMAQSTREQITYAGTIVFGKVTNVQSSANGTYFTVTTERVYKGNPDNPVVLYSSSYTGPNGGRMTSVDYGMALGESHTLYMRTNENNQYETNACSGSHPGQPTAEETRLLGEGRPATPPGVSPAESAKQTAKPIRLWIPFIAIGVTVIAIGAVVLSTKR